MKRVDFLKSVEKYRNNNNNYCIDLFKERELKTNKDIIQEENYIEFLRNNKFLQKEHQLFFKNIGLNFNLEDVSNFDYKIKLDMDTLEVEGKEIYCISLNPNHLYDIWVDKNKENKKSIVFRLENEKGEGVYTARGCGFLFRNISNIQVAPERDGEISFIFSNNFFKSKEEIKYAKKWFFGFKNIEQYKKWFSIEERNKIKKLGLKLNKYEVDENYVVEGQNQIIFIKEKSNKIQNKNTKKYKIKS